MNSGTPAAIDGRTSAANHTYTQDMQLARTRYYIISYMLRAPCAACTVGGDELGFSPENVSAGVIISGAIRLLHLACDRASDHATTSGPRA